MPPSPSLRSAYRATMVTMVLVYSYLILRGHLWVGQADLSSRVLRSVSVADALLPYALTWSSWTDVWPAGHFLLQGGWITLLRGMGVDRPLAVIQGVLWLAIPFWIATVSAVRAAIAQDAGEDAGFLAGLVVMAYPLLASGLTASYSELFAAALFTACLASVIAFDRSRAAGWLATGAALALAATSLRTESVFAALGVGLILVLRTGVVPGIAFSLVASGLFLARVAWALGFSGEGVHFLNYTRTLYAWFGGPALHMLWLVVLVAVPTGLPLWWLARSMQVDRSDLRRSTWMRGPATFAYPAAGALVALAFLAFAIVTGNSNAQPRFTMLPGIGLIMAVCALARVDARTWWSQRAWAWIAVIASVHVVQGVGPLRHEVFEQRRVPASVKEAARWLRANVSQDEHVAIDFLGWWEQPLLLYGTVWPGQPVESYTWSQRPRLPESVERRLAERAVSDPATLKDREAHAYVAHRRPRYLVLTSAGFFPEVLATRFSGQRRSHSMFRAFLQEEGDRRVLRSPYQDGLVVEVRTAFQNGMVEVVHLEWESSDDAP